MLQYIQFTAYIFDEPFVTPQVHRTSTAMKTKPKPPVTAVPVTTIILGEVSFPTQRVQFCMIKSESVKRRERFSFGSGELRSGDVGRGFHFIISFASDTI